jgi:hypothetical protein
VKCPRPDFNCSSQNFKIIHKCEICLDVPHQDMECLQCHYRFNHWLINNDKLKEIFGKDWKIYE